MVRVAFLFVTLCVASIYAAHQTYPGTSTRPVLSDTEAASYTKAKYLQGWTPGTITVSHADYTVKAGEYIQTAVNSAIKAGGTTRKYIHVQDGTYKQAVIIPQTTVPITIFGNSANPANVHIVLTQGADMTGSAYASQVNPSGKVFKSGDPAYSIYSACAARSTLGTACSAVVVALANNVELAYLTIDNPSKSAQAVALRTGGDKQNFESLYLYGFQDTLQADGTRLYFHKPTIKGDVDFIFGGASAVFDGATIIARADRPRSSAVIFAPDTPNAQKYGYLLINSKISSETAIKSAKGLSLARAWDASSVPTANGQLVIRETSIDESINVSAPYQQATSGRAYAGNANTNRNLDDSKYNRFWEYKNTGSGA